MRSLRNQLEEQQASTQASVKSLKRVQEELDESVVQVDELTRAKLEVCCNSLRNLSLSFLLSPSSLFSPYSSVSVISSIYIGC